MPRRREVPKREILPDPKYGNIELSKFMNVVMESGKKAVAERIIYGALEQIQSKSGKDPLELFSNAINNVKPMVEVKIPPRWWCQLPGARGGSPCTSLGAVHALDQGSRSQAR